MLRISRLEASTDRSAFSTVDLRDVIQDVVEVFEPTLADREQIAIIAGASRPVTVFADEQMLKQLLTNLLQNFNRHTPAGSTVTLSACRPGNGGATLQVTDNGPGIPAETHDDILEPFRRHGATISLANNHPGLRVTVCFPPLPANLSNL
ncbi:Histidine kinase-, DNA gyrase B-, and HSP90-like ATPase [Nitrosomonas sp. Nm51]|uniref:sensor histidine kinase n=1 Tax=Nitrosomonas sp. Nm51 TaxID=133720 RepID=UPI0008ACD871|nr:HAMP domain-containing sensor histidine kinase [Nitrosomonas sp. Nm51]SER58092.1 Histidine kinase-, DNA gyrase B-, and HSP90-like ATPase [Nitrosomonas sp. Nm51]